MGLKALCRSSQITNNLSYCEISFFPIFTLFALISETSFISIASKVSNGFSNHFKIS